MVENISQFLKFDVELLFFFKFFGQTILSYELIYIMHLREIIKMMNLRRFSRFYEIFINLHQIQIHQFHIKP